MNKEKIDFINFVKKYAIEELGFNKDNSFERHDPNLEEVYYLSWSPKTKLKICYAPYESSYEAEQQFNNIRKMGYDVVLYALEAIGDENFPITESLLKDTPERIAYTILHEKWHNFSSEYTSNWKNCGIIDESCGHTIGLNEAINIVKQFYGTDSEELKKAVKQLEDRKERGKKIKLLAEELNELYQSEKSEPEILKEREKICKKYDWEANNADIGFYYPYYALFGLTNSIYSTYNRKKSIEIFISALKVANKDFKEGIEELLKYYDGNKEEYRKVFNVFDY